MKGSASLLVFSSRVVCLCIVVACGFLKDDFHVLVHGKTFQGASGRNLPAVFHHLLHAPVRPLLVMMEEPEPGDPGVKGKLQGVRVDGMAPCPGQAVVLGTKFGVVDEEVRPFRKGAVILNAIPPGCGRQARYRSERRRIFLPPRTGIPSPGWGG